MKVDLLPRLQKRVAAQDETLAEWAQLAASDPSRALKRAEMATLATVRREETKAVIRALGRNATPEFIAGTLRADIITAAMGGERSTSVMADVFARAKMQAMCEVLEMVEAEDE